MIFDRVNDAIEVIDAQSGQFLEVNARACADLGYTREEMLCLGVPDIEAVLPSDFHWGQHVARMRELGTMMFQGLHKRKDRSTFPVEVSCSYVELAERAYVLAVIRDMTVHKRMEGELKSALEAAQAADRAKGDFLATMTHEMRTPLTLILGPLESLLARAEADRLDAARESIARVLRNATRLKTLVDDVLDFSKAQAGKMEFHLESVDVVEATAQIVRDVEPTARAKGICLTFVPPQDPIGVATLDVDKFEKILLNLVGNALKFTPANGTVDVGLLLSGDAFELFVRDTGIGIAADKLTLLFKRFQQIDTSQTRRYGGTGIGLALVREFAVGMGGDVHAESTLGQGARFAVRLPRGVDGVLTPRRVRPLHGAELHRTRDLSEGAPASPSDRRSDGNAPRLLVVEDNADMRAYLSDLLAGDYQVAAAENGRVALEALREAPVDVVLSDAMMPELSGPELVAQMKRDPALRSIPVVLLTAQASREALVTGLDGGADDYLGKPFSAAELRARLNAVVRLQRAHRMLEARTRELVEAQEMLIESTKLAALGRMLTSLSHEINNPMAIIQGNIQPIREYLDELWGLIGRYQDLGRPLARCDAEALARAGEGVDLESLRAELSSSLTDIEMAGERVQGIQSDLRQFLRGQGPDISAADLNAVISSTLEMLKRTVPLDVAVLADLAPLPLVPIHAGQIGQVVLNLLQNAVHAVGKVGVITVRTHATADAVQLEVIDDGPGVAPGARSHIFEPFFTTKEVGKGTGLGLAVTRQIVVDNHGGTIRLDDAHAPGAKFVVELPLKGSAGKTRPR